MAGLGNPLKNKVAAYEPATIGDALNKARLIESLGDNDEKEALIVAAPPGNQETLLSVDLGPSMATEQRGLGEVYEQLMKNAEKMSHLHIELNSQCMEMAKLKETLREKEEILQEKNKIIENLESNTISKRLGHHQALGEQRDHQENDLSLPHEGDLYSNECQGTYIPSVKRDCIEKPRLVTCFHCGIKGHVIRDCRAWKRLREGGGGLLESSTPSSTTQKANRVDHPINEDMMCEILINGKKGLALMDSGSATTILSKDFFRKIHPKPEVFTPTFNYITGVGGNRSRIFGRTQAKLEIGKFQTIFPMQILQGTNYDAIFGRDFIDEFVESVNVRARQMTLINDGHAPCAVGEIGEWCTAALARSTTIYPGTRRVVSVYPTANIVAKCFEIKGTKMNRVQGITVIPGKVVGSSGTMKCVLVSRSDRTVRLEADALVAKLRECPLQQGTSAQGVGGSVNIIELGQAVPQGLQSLVSHEEPLTVPNTAPEAVSQVVQGLVVQEAQLHVPHLVPEAGTQVIQGMVSTEEPLPVPNVAPEAVPQGIQSLVVQEAQLPVSHLVPQAVPQVTQNSGAHKEFLTRPNIRGRRRWKKLVEIPEEPQIEGKTEIITKSPTGTPEGPQTTEKVKLKMRTRDPTVEFGVAQGKQEILKVYPRGMQAESSLKLPQAETRDLPGSPAAPREGGGTSEVTPAGHWKLAFTLADLWDIEVSNEECRIPGVSENDLRKWGEVLDTQVNRVKLLVELYMRLFVSFLEGDEPLGGTLEASPELGKGCQGDQRGQQPLLPSHSLTPSVPRRVRDQRGKNRSQGDGVLKGTKGTPGNHPITIQDHRRVREKLEYLVNGKWCPAASIKDKATINNYLRGYKGL